MAWERVRTENRGPVGGDQVGQQADVSVTVHSVRVKELPGLDDEFAQRVRHARRAPGRPPGATGGRQTPRAGRHVIALPPAAWTARPRIGYGRAATANRPSPGTIGFCASVRVTVKAERRPGPLTPKGGGALRQ